MMANAAPRRPRVLLVVARYREDASWVLHAPCDDAIVYDKGGGAALAGTSVRHVTLPNVGRETHTFLHHIAENYATLRDHDFVCFAQGRPFDHCPDFLARLARAPVDGARFTPLAAERLEFTVEGGCPAHHEALPLREFCAHAGLSAAETGGTLAFGPGGQFVVSTAAILERPRAFYRGLLRLVDGETDPIYGYVLERMWGPIFGCPS